MNTTLVWATPNGDELLAHIARVSNPANQDNPDIEGLIRYMRVNEHWSPFEMVSACIEIETTRDIGRQILRHRSFSFQEFSQRYADATVLPTAEHRECRMQDTKNRQNSLQTDDEALSKWWRATQDGILDHSMTAYRMAIEKGIAKEQARAVLPEGLTTSRMYMTGTLRSWMHYTKVRTDRATQKEHRVIALGIAHILSTAFPKSYSL